MTFLQYFIVFLIAYLCVYILVDRICRCVERCASAKTLLKCMSDGELSDLVKMYKESRKESI